MSRIRTISFKGLPSVVVSYDFVRELGEILEADIPERIARGKEVAEEEIKDRKITEEEWKESVRERHYPRYTLEYTIQTPTETFEFRTSKDLIETSLLSDEILDFSAQISHYDAKYTDAIIRISRKDLSLSKISSSNEARLLKVKEDILKLFSRYKTTWEFLYRDLFGEITLLHVLSVSIVAFVIYKIIDLSFPFLNDVGSRSILVYGLILGFFVLVGVLTWLLSSLFPRTEFQFSKVSSVGLQRSVLLALVLAVLGSSLYDIFRLLFL